MTIATDATDDDYGAALERVRSLLASSSMAGVRAASAPLVHLNAHIDDDGACLCARCIEKTGAAVVHQGERFTLDVVAARGRALFFWHPDRLLDDRERVRARMTKALEHRLRLKAPRRRRNTTVSKWTLSRNT